MSKRGQKVFQDSVRAVLNEQVDAAYKSVQRARVASEQLEPGISDATIDLFEAERAIKRVVDGLRLYEPKPEAPTYSQSGADLQASGTGLEMD